MLKKTLLTLSVTCALSAANSNTADAQAGLGLQARKPATTFLQPLKLDLVLRPGDSRLPQFCATSGRASCPPVVAGGGIPGGGTADDIGYHYRHVRVSFYVAEISNEIVANGGADLETLGLFVEWLTSSPADVQNGGPYLWTVPGPGQTFSDLGMYPGNSNPSGLLIYDALIYDSCGTFSWFPVDHEATVTESSAGIGSFVGTDMIESTGYYNLSYAIRAEDSNGGVSDIRFKGIAAAICSGQSSL